MPSACPSTQAPLEHLRAAYIRTHESPRSRLKFVAQAKEDSPIIAPLRGLSQYLCTCQGHGDRLSVGTAGDSPSPSSRTEFRRRESTGPDDRPGLHLLVHLWSAPTRIVATREERQCDVFCGRDGGLASTALHMQTVNIDYGSYSRPNLDLNEKR